MKSTKPGFLVVLLSLFIAASSLAQWNDCSQLLPAVDSQDHCYAAGDGSGGAIVFQYGSYANGSTTGIMVSRVDHDGDVVWGPGCIQVDDPIALHNRTMSDDDDTAWLLYHNGSQILLMKASPDGDVRGNIDVSEEFPNYLHEDCMDLCSNDDGGAWVAYPHPAGDDGNHLYLRWISQSGNMYRRWILDDVFDPTNPQMDDTYIRVRVTPDGSGGCFVVWTNSHVVPGLDTKMYAQHMISRSTMGWPAYPDGKEILPNAVGISPSYPRVVGDDNGGFYVVWTAGNSVRAQRFDSNGDQMWSGYPSGKTIGTGQKVTMVSDGLGGMIIAWNDGDAGLTQRVDSSGNLLWSVTSGYSGKLVSDDSGPISGVVPETGGGFSCFWTDDTGYLCVERFDNAGNEYWTGEDHQLCTASSSDGLSVDDDGAGGAITVHITSNNTIIMGNRIPLVPYEIDDSTLLGKLKYNELYDDWSWEFIWETSGYCDPGNDQVTVTGRSRNHGGCELGPNESVVLEEGVDHVSVSLTLLPSGQYQHMLTWDHRGCAAKCSYNWFANSGDHLGGDTSTTTQFATPACTSTKALGDMPDNAKAGFAPAQPNPFNPLTQLSFYVPVSARNAELKIYNVSGKLVRSFSNMSFGAGWNEITWRGLDNGGVTVSSGLYFAQLVLDGQQYIQKLVMLK